MYRLVPLLLRLSSKDSAAIACNPLTGAMGLRCTSAHAFTAVKPTRKPVKEPGPAATAKTSIWSRLKFSWRCNNATSRNSLVE